jgi:hypothetical protein
MKNNIYVLHKGNGDKRKRKRAIRKYCKTAIFRFYGF